MLLDSARVFEDLEYALRGPPIDKDNHKNNKQTASEEKNALPSCTQVHLTKTNAIDISAEKASNTIGSSGDGDSDSRVWKMNLVARAWDHRLKPVSEFRGICWNNKLTCLAQYFHPLYFEELQNVELKAQIEQDILQTYSKAKHAVAQLGGHCIIDFAWLGEVTTKLDYIFFSDSPLLCSLWYFLISSSYLFI